MPNINIGETDKSVFADQQFISISYNGKLNAIGGVTPPPLNYRVTFIANNKTYYIIDVGENQKISAPQVNPTSIVEGYTFKEWQLNGSAFNFDTVIESNIELVAKFEEQSDDFIDGIFTFTVSEGSAVCIIADQTIPELDLDKSYSITISSEDKTQIYTDIDSLSFKYDEEIISQISSAPNGYIAIIENPESGFIKPNGDESIKFMLMTTSIIDSGNYYVHMTKNNEQSFKPLNDTEDFVLVQVTNGVLQINSEEYKSCEMEEELKYLWGSSNSAEVINKTDYKPFDNYCMLNRILYSPITIDDKALQVRSVSFTFEQDISYILISSIGEESSEVVMYNGPMNVKNYENDTILYYGNESYVDYILENYYVAPNE